MNGMQTVLARLAVPAGALCVCAVTDPDHPPGWIVCPFRLLTGWPCPLCGMTRGVASLLRGRWADGISFHLFSPFVLAAFAAWIVIEIGQAARLWDARRIGHWALRPGPWLAFFAMSCVYGVLRWCGIIGVPRA
ncbi:MAG: DUF2752 domain-containing protein [Acidobacteria bacterium]|nr:DUF2752 domain-containing protein [Acidobacteriota bacterium]